MRSILALTVVLAVIAGSVPTAAEDAPGGDRELTDLRWLSRNLRFALDRARRGVAESKTIGVYLDRGVFPPSGIAVVRRLDEAGTPPRLLFASAVTAKGLKGLRVVVFPGGWAPSQLAGLGAEGQRALVDHVQGGGRFLGICAGGYVPCTKVRWEGVNHPYPLDLVRGTATGPVPGRAPWPTAEVFDLDLGRNRREKALYAGGASFDVKDATVLARYPGGAPAAIEVKRRKGKLVLTGAHVEFSTRADADLLGEGEWAKGLEPGDASLFTTWLDRLR